jgi:small subunit ribosomal protein S17
MQKTLEGNVVSVKSDTIIVEVTRRVPHPLYKKIMKKSKRYKVDRSETEVELGDKVKIVSIRPLSKEKYFKILKVVK